MRHAEPAITGVLLGQNDPPLSPNATRPILPPGIVWTSALRRARETAEGIIVPALNEITYGEWDGLTWTEIEQRWPDLAKQKLENWTAVTPPGGEPWQDFHARVTAAVAEPRPLGSGGPGLVIVAHEAVNAIIAAHFTGQDPTQFQQAYCAIKSYDL